MKKTIIGLLALSILFVWSCNNSSTNNEKSSLSIEKENSIDLLNASFNGNEPFWNIVFESDFAIFKSPTVPEEGTKIYYKEKNNNTENIKLDEAIIKVSDKEYKIWGLMDNSNIEIIIRKENCDDGMSPDKYNLKIIIVSNNDTLEGCGNSKQS